MNKFFLLFCTSVILLSGCNLFETKQGENTVQPITDTSPKEKPIIKPFTKDSLSALLVAEFAERRGQFDLALENYVNQAQQTKDPKIAERAYQMASYLDNSKQQLDMALLWASIEPNNIDANRAAAIELAKNERGREATPYFEKVLASTEQLDFLDLTNSNLTQKARQEVIVSIDQLAIKHPSNAKITYTKAILLAENGAAEEALTTLQKLPTEQQKKNNVVLLKVFLLQSVGKPEEALALLDKEVKNRPENKKLRLSFAHRLISQGKLPEAKQQFLTLSKQYPEDEELRFALVLICLENQEWDEAISYLQTMLTNGINSDAIYYYLATAYNEKGDKDQALANYKQVTGGENYLAAIANTAKILFERNQMAEAQQLLSATRKNQPDLAIPLYLFEIEELQKLDKLPQAWQIINQAIKADPKNTSLLYSRALLAEQSNNLPQAEKDLRYIIRLEPNNDSAINALGYILTDRTTRYQEALTLIEHALKLNPENPAALDSLGWVKYKLGDLTAAKKYLQQAYDSYPDPDVAAHLGEVLWKKGEQQQAKDIWSKALKDNPTNKTLQKTIKRLTGAEEL